MKPSYNNNRKNGASAQPAYRGARPTNAVRSAFNAKPMTAAKPTHAKSAAPKQTSKPQNLKVPSLTDTMRINRYLALRKYATRRGADELISKGVVFINGKRAQLGDQVSGADQVEVRQKKKPTYTYLAYNKPKGIVTHSAQDGEEDINMQIADEYPGVFPIGRLDKDSYGLIILTNDGRITDPLLNPDYAHTKEYIVAVKGKLRSSFKEKMERGVDIGDYMTKPCKVKILNDSVFAITLTEGKKHQIRRMCDALFQEVYDLKRSAIMNIRLGKLAPGAHRVISGEELAEFLKSLGF